LVSKYTILEKINNGLLVMSESNMPPAHVVFYDLFDVGNRIDCTAACEYLDTPEKTVRAWYLKKHFPAMATKLLFIKFRGFLPYTSKWKDCHFDKDENIVTPYGVCRPSDIAFVHRYKWSGEQSREELAKLKSSSDIINQGLLSNQISEKIQELQALTEQFKPGANISKAGKVG
jgi:hypothetical protein